MAREHPLMLQCLLISFILSSYLIATQSSKIPRLSPIGIGHKISRQLASLDSATSDLQDFATFYYNQTLDHFNYRPESYTTFPQKYVINSKYWGGSNSSDPIFVYFGAEAPLDGQIQAIGFLTDNAASFNALLVYIEHRYYGESVPFGSFKEAMKNAEIRGYFDSAQALADYAEVIIHIKKTFNATMSPVIVIGGSYGGMLASWFRLKYPHLALGALASSAPILYFDTITPSDAYDSVVTRDFREASESCFETILNSWSEIDRVASEANGLFILSQRFNTCSPLKDSSELKDFLVNLYRGAAQYDQPPLYPVNMICNAIDNNNGSDILSKIYAGLVAYMGSSICYPISPNNSTTDETELGWTWMTCSEMVIPIGHENETMFPPNPFNKTRFVEECQQLFGILPRSYWVTTYYGGHDIKLVLQRFGSNIIFSNGLRDPYSSGGILDNISDSIVAIHTANGSHCLDILGASSSDPDWLIKQRDEEIKVIKLWIAQYFADLHALKQS